MGKLKWLLASLFTIFCFILGTIPITVMYILWNIIDPATSAERMFTVIAFLLAGDSTTIFMLIISFMVFVWGIAAIMDA